MAIKSNLLSLEKRRKVLVNTSKMRILDKQCRRLFLVILLTTLIVMSFIRMATRLGLLENSVRVMVRNERNWYAAADSPVEQEEDVLSRCRTGELSPIGVSHKFLAHQPFSLPDDYIRPLEDILELDWVCDLEHFLSRVDPMHRLVSIIAANSNFTEPLLNWIIGVSLRLEEPLIDWIVVSLDEPLHNMLRHRGIPSLLVTPESVMYTDRFPDVYHMHNGIYQARMIVMRLINRLGYHCANYDTDALLLKNPRVIYEAPIYANVDIFAGYAISFPPKLHRVWGATLCNGAMMIRSNLRTEIFWENVALTPNAGCERGMDQCKFNYAFYRMKLNWTSTAESVKIFTADSVWRAHGDVEVFIVSLNTICRQRFCVEENIDKYYIWHKGSCAKTAEAKKESVEFGQLWWLRDDWKEMTEGMQLQGKDFIHFITDNSKL